MNNEQLEKQILEKINSVSDYYFKGLTDVDDRQRSLLLRSLDVGKKIGLNKQEFDYLIKNSDLKQADNFGFDALMVSIFCHLGASVISHEQFDYLIKNSDLSRASNDGRDSLSLVFQNNKSGFLNLKEEQLDYLIKNSDLSRAIPGDGNNLMIALRHNQAEGLNLKEEQMDYLIKNSDLKQNNGKGRNSLMEIFRSNKTLKLNLKEEQMDYLIKNSDLGQIDQWGWSGLIEALLGSDEENLKLSKDQWLYLIENSNLLQICGRGGPGKTSVLGLTQKVKPKLIEVVFRKAINDKNFNLDNYKEDIYYKEICQIVEACKIKQNIDGEVEKADATNNHLKI